MGRAKGEGAPGGKSGKKKEKRKKGHQKLSVGCLVFADELLVDWSKNIEVSKK